MHNVVPVAVETLGSFGYSANIFIVGKITACYGGEKGDWLSSSAS